MKKNELMEINIETLSNLPRRLRNRLVEAYQENLKKQRKQDKKEVIRDTNKIYYMKHYRKKKKEASMTQVTK